MSRIAVSCVIGLILASTGPAGAEPITALGTSHFREVRSPNTLGVLSGDRLTIVGDFRPNPSTGDLGTSVIGSQGTVTGLGLPYLNSPALPNQFGASVPYDPALTGSWLLTVTNPNSAPTTVMVNTPVVGTATTPEFIRGFSLVGAGSTPTFNWAPSSFTHDSQTLFISDRPTPNGPPRIIHLTGLAAGATSYTVPGTLSGGGTLELGTHYWVNINVNDTRQDGSLLSRARTIVAFLVQNTAPSNPLFLPTVGPDGIFHFDIPGVGSQTIFIDPPAAVGYQYAIGTGNPNFASVLLPLVGDGQYAV